MVILRRDAVGFFEILFTSFGVVVVGPDAGFVVLRILPVASRGVGLHAGFTAGSPAVFDTGLFVELRIGLALLALLASLHFKEQLLFFEYKEFKKDL